MSVCTVKVKVLGVDCMGEQRVVCGGRDKISGCRNTNKTKVGFCFLGFWEHFWEKIKGGVGGLNWV